MKFKQCGTETRHNAVTSLNSQTAESLSIKNSGSTMLSLSWFVCSNSNWNGYLLDLLFLNFNFCPHRPVKLSKALFSSSLSYSLPCNWLIVILLDFISFQNLDLSRAWALRTLLVLLVF